MTEEWRIRHNRKLEELYNDTNIVEVMRSRRLQCGGHVTRTDAHRRHVNMMDFIAGGRRPLDRTKKRWSDGHREDFIQIGIGGELETEFDEGGSL